MTLKKMRVTELIYNVWFPKTVKSIYVVVKRDSDPPQDAYAFSKEYKYLDRMGDKDLILYTYAFLARYYPNANIEICISEDFIKRADYEKNNLVILGGPSSNHEVCQQFMTMSIVSDILKYPPNEVKKVELCAGCPYMEDVCPRESICIQNKIYCYKSGSVIIDSIEAEKAKIPKNRIKNLNNGKVQVFDCIMLDKSIFASIINPFAPDKKVILISGIHCMGGVGAFRAFDATSRQSIDNYKYHNEKLAEAKEFIAVFDIDINPRSGTPITCPVLEKSILYNLDEKRTIMEKQTIIYTAHTEVKDELKFDLSVDREECISMIIEMKKYVGDESIPDFSKKVKNFIYNANIWIKNIQVYSGKRINVDNAKTFHCEFEKLCDQYRFLKGIGGI